MRKNIMPYLLGGLFLFESISGAGCVRMAKSTKGLEKEMEAIIEKIRYPSAQELEKKREEIEEIRKSESPYALFLDGYRSNKSQLREHDWPDKYRGLDSLVGPGCYKINAWDLERVAEENPNADICFGKIENGKIKIKALKGRIAVVPEGYGVLLSKLEWKNEILWGNNQMFAYNIGDTNTICNMALGPLTGDEFGMLVDSLYLIDLMKK